MRSTTTEVRRNPRLTGFASLDGSDGFGVVDLFEGSPASRKSGRPTSLAALYSSYPDTLPNEVGPLPTYAAWLPYLSFPSLGEGGTPLLPVERASFAPELGALLLKREAANPTGSHKDRMSPLAVARAIEIGARGVACASSGNAALSLAAYAAASGIPCKIVVTPLLTDQYRRLIQRMGSGLDVVPEPLARWDRIAALVRDGWFPVTNYALPASGSNPFGVQGYRTIAFELQQQAGPLDAVIVPTARGDLIWGISDGYRALGRAGLLQGKCPMMVAVEPLPRLARVLAGEASTTDRFPGATRQFSTAGETTTDQALRAVLETGGTAVVVDDGAALEAQTALARQGQDLELCAAAAFAALPKLLARGALGAGARVAVIATAASAREPAPELPALAAWVADRAR